MGGVRRSSSSRHWVVSPAETKLRTSSRCLHGHSNKQPLRGSERLRRSHACPAMQQQVRFANSEIRGFIPQKKDGGGSASKMHSGSETRFCSKDHASDLEEVRSLVLRRSPGTCLEEELLLPVSPLFITFANCKTTIS